MLILTLVDSNLKMKLEQLKTRLRILSIIRNIVKLLNIKFLVNHDQNHIVLPFEVK